MGYWGAGILTGIGQAVHERNLLDLQMDLTRRKDLMTQIQHLADHPDMSDEGRTQLTNHMMQIQMADLRKPLPKELATIPTTLLTPRKSRLPMTPGKPAPMGIGVSGSVAANVDPRDTLITPGTPGEYAAQLPESPLSQLTSPTTGMDITSRLQNRRVDLHGTATPTGIPAEPPKPPEDTTRFFYSPEEKREMAMAQWREQRETQQEYAMEQIAARMGWTNLPKEKMFGTQFRSLVQNDPRYDAEASTYTFPNGSKIQIDDDQEYAVYKSKAGPVMGALPSAIGMSWSPAMYNPWTQESTFYPRPTAAPSLDQMSAAQVRPGDMPPMAAQFYPQSRGISRSDDPIMGTSREATTTQRVVGQPPPGMPQPNATSDRFYLFPPASRVGQQVTGAIQHMNTQPVITTPRSVGQGMAATNQQVAKAVEATTPKPINVMQPVAQSIRATALPSSIPQRNGEPSTWEGTQAIMGATTPDQIRQLSPEEAKARFSVLSTAAADLLANAPLKQEIVDKVQKIRDPMNPDSATSRRLQAAALGVLKNPREAESYTGDDLRQLRSAMHEAGLAWPTRDIPQDADILAFATNSLENLRDLRNMIISGIDGYIIGPLLGRYSSLAAHMGFDPLNQPGMEYLNTQFQTFSVYNQVMEAKVMMGARPAIQLFQSFRAVSPHSAMTLRQLMGTLEGSMEAARNAIKRVYIDRWGPDWKKYAPDWNEDWMPGAPQEGDWNWDPKSNRLMRAVKNPQTGTLWWALSPTTDLKGVIGNADQWQVPVLGDGTYDKNYRIWPPPGVRRSTPPPPR